MSEQFNVEGFVQQCLAEYQAREVAQQQQAAEAEARNLEQMREAANKAREQVLDAVPADLRDYLKAFDEAGDPVMPARLELPGCTPVVVSSGKAGIRFSPTWASFDPNTYRDRIFYAYELISADDMIEAIHIAHKNFATIARAQEECNRWNEPEQTESKPTHGVCRVCGCTDNHACEGGCSWVDDEHTLCSRCAEKGAPQSDPLALTPENVNQAHVALAGARNAIFNVAIVRDQIKANIKTLKAKAVADGRINGKNEDVREAQAHEIFAADYEALADTETELDKAQLEYDLADIEVKRLRALICLATTKSEPIPF
jgi:hypothetical protein